MPEPRVSVIVPVYNKASYLAAALDSVLGQTFAGGIELVCVDNGSTDGSLEILREYEARLGSTTSAVTSFRLIEQDHTGPGVARNAGLDVAQGDYACFLDSDDFLDVRTFEKAVARADAQGLDILVWDCWYYNDRLQRDQHPPVGTLEFGAFAPWGDAAERVFRAADNPDAAFTSFQNWPWNKLFRRSFLEEFGLRFPAMFRTEDLPFCCMAFVRARRMGVLYDRLSHYRIHTGISAMDVKDNHPLDFLEAFLLLKRELEEAGLYGTYQRSFARWALSGCVYNLDSLRGEGTFSLAFRRLKEGGLDELGITDEALEGYGNRFELEALEALRTRDEAGYLRWLANALENVLADHRAQVDVLEAERDAERERTDATRRDLQAQLEDVRRELDEQRDRYDELAARHDAMVNSAEYRSGRALCKIPRAIQRRMLGK